MTDLGKNQMLILGQDDMGQQVIIMEAGQMESEQCCVTIVYDIFRLFGSYKTSEQTEIAWKKVLYNTFCLDRTLLLSGPKSGQDIYVRVQFYFKYITFQAFDKLKILC